MIARDMLACPKEFVENLIVAKCYLEEKYKVGFVKGFISKNTAYRKFLIIEFKKCGM